MDELIAYAQSIIDFLSTIGANLNTESQQALGQLLQNILQVIEQQEQGSPAEGLIPQVEAAPHASSNINAFQYDPESKRLVVKFQDKYPSQNGPEYLYEDVPAYIYDVFRRGAVAPKTSGKNAWHRWKKGVTPSHGASMYALIKQGGYNFRRLS